MIDRVPAGTVTFAWRLSSVVALPRSAAVTGPIVTGAPALFPLPPARVSNTAVIAALSPWLATPPRYALRFAFTWPASISPAAADTSMTWRAELDGVLGPPAKKFVWPPMASLTDVGGKPVRP